MPVHPMNFVMFKRSASMNTRIFRMLETHARIDDALRREQGRTGGNWQQVRELKKLKLRIKDLIQRLMARSMSARARG
jgi:uncharacterized protein